MAATQQDLVGRDVYARDGDKVGQIRELVYDGDYELSPRDKAILDSFYIRKAA
jgi:hypothetical protein